MISCSQQRGVERESARGREIFGFCSSVSFPEFSCGARRGCANLHHQIDPGRPKSVFYSSSCPTCCSMSECGAYSSAEGALVDGFSCPRPGNAASAVYCCGFNDVKYCCDDPNSFFPYDYEYMWWLRYGFFQAFPKYAQLYVQCRVEKVIFF